LDPREKQLEKKGDARSNGGVERLMLWEKKTKSLSIVGRGGTHDSKGEPTKKN